MRTVDADELRKHSFTVYQGNGVELEPIEVVPLAEIDNATTVEQPVGISDKLQGEWIACTKSGMPLTEYGRMTGEKWYGFKCSQCKFIYKGNALIESPFCQKCGADMRKGGAE